MTKETLAQLNYRFPRYINYCVDLVKQRVEIQIDKMVAVAKSCDQCKSCAYKGFKNPVFINSVCEVPDSDVSNVTDIFRQSSSTIFGLENPWQYYRDDANGKMNYLTSKMKTPGNEFLDSFQYFNDSYSFLPVNFTKLDEFSAKLNQFGENYLSQTISGISNAILQFDTYFRQQTDFFILLVNQEASDYIISGWNICRDKFIVDIFDHALAFVYDWQYRVSLFFDIEKTDVAISQSYSLAYNFSQQLHQCVKGIEKNSSRSDLDSAEICLNSVNFLVKNFRNF